MFKVLTNTSFGDVNVAFFKDGFFYVERAVKDKVVDSKRLSFFKKSARSIKGFKMALFFFDNVRGFLEFKNDFKTNFSDITDSTIIDEVIFSKIIKPVNYIFNHFKAKKMIHDLSKIHNLIDLVNIDLTNPSDELLINVLNKSLTFKKIPDIKSDFNNLKKFFKKDDSLVSEGFIDNLLIGKVAKADDFYLIKSVPFQIINTNEGVYYYVANNILSKLKDLRFFIAKLIRINDLSQNRGGKRDFIVISKLSDYKKINLLIKPLNNLINSFNESELLNFTVSPVIFFKDEHSNNYDLSLLLHDSIKDKFLKIYYSFIGDSLTDKGLLYSAFSNISTEIAVKSRLIFLNNFRQLVAKELMKGGDFNKIVINSFFKAVIVELNTLKKLLLKAKKPLNYPIIKAHKGLVAYSVISGVAAAYEPQNVIVAVKNLEKIFSKFLND